MVTLLGAGALAVILYDAAHIALALARGRDVAAASEAYERAAPSQAPALLVAGDSTAVGTGAADPADSVAGRIARDLSPLHIDNLGRNGARLADVAAQLRRAPRRHYRVLLIQAGGNDILQFTGYARLREDIDRVLQLATARGDRVLLMATGDVGTAPAIPWPLSVLLSERARRVRDLLAHAAGEREAVHFVDLMQEGADSPFRREPARYYAEDGLHPSGEGYGLWYAQLRRSVSLAQWLAAGEPAPGPPAAASSTTYARQR